MNVLDLNLALDAIRADRDEMDTLRRRPREPEDGSDVIGLAIGVLGSLALSVAMIPLRDHLHNDNMALALVVPVLIAAVIGGRLAGAVSAITAALCFDFFFTQPYQSLRIASSNDIASFVVLLIVALISAEVGIRARRGGQPRASRARISTALPRHRARGTRRRHRRRRVVGPGRADRPVRPPRLRVRDRAVGRRAPPARHPRRDRGGAARRDAHRLPAAARRCRAPGRRARHTSSAGSCCSPRSRCEPRCRSGSSRWRSPTSSASRSRRTRSADARR